MVIAHDFAPQRRCKNTITAQLNDLISWLCVCVCCIGCAPRLITISASVILNAIYKRPATTATHTRRRRRPLIPCNINQTVAGLRLAIRPQILTIFAAAAHDYRVRRLRCAVQCVCAAGWLLYQTNKDEQGVCVCV